ncbi:GtrA family protein [Sphingomonas baiyangensis]|uniref:GtrA family protein n=1 Tax=Sphingomonas baiyangensis TaxID=2572576 RepID=A0A4U1L8S6_9SPHN|nr:GtrA family protein [Sphingomonas baiyangensis]
MLGQILRFLVAGGITTLLYSAVYLTLTWRIFGNERAVLAVPFAFAVAVAAGFVLHSRFSFRGHGSRTGAGQQARFVAVQGLGLGLHALITWVATNLLAQPAWVPLVPGLLIVPAVTFLLNRQWVFR